MATIVGDRAPEVAAGAFVRGAQGPVPISLAEQRGRWVVLFFYPADFTFVCPTEIAAFADLAVDLAAEDAVVIGASTDGYHTHRAWYESEPRLAGVRFPILADTTHDVARAFGVLCEDGLAMRATFVIDPEGIVRSFVAHDRQVGRSAEETLRVVQALRTGGLCPAGWRVGEPTLVAS